MRYSAGENWGPPGFCVRIASLILDLSIIRALLDLLIFSSDRFLQFAIEHRAIAAIQGMDLALSGSNSGSAGVTDATENPTSAVPWALISVFLISWLYYALIEVSPFASSIGKAFFSLRVTDYFQQNISLKQASLRHLARVIPFIPVVYLFVAPSIDSKLVTSWLINVGLVCIFLGPICSYITVAMSSRRQALHDFMSSSLVLYKSPPTLIRKIRGFTLVILISLSINIGLEKFGIISLTHLSQTGDISSDSLKNLYKYMPRGNAIPQTRGHIRSIRDSREGTVSLLLGIGRQTKHI